jgi:hypothetical protein
MKQLLVLCAALLPTASVQADLLPKDGDAWTKDTNDLSTAWVDPQDPPGWVTYAGNEQWYPRIEMSVSTDSAVGTNSMLLETVPGPPRWYAMCLLSNSVNASAYEKLHVWLKKDDPSASTWEVLLHSTLSNIHSYAVSPTTNWNEFVIPITNFNPGHAGPEFGAADLTNINHISIHAYPMKTSLPYGRFWVDGVHFERQPLGTVFNLH